MLHIVSELMLAAMMATPLASGAPDAALAAAGFTPPEPSPLLLLTLPDYSLRTDSPAAAADGAAALGSATPSDRLARERGGAGIVSDTRLGGEVAGNTAIQVVTGANSIDAGSFSGSVGLPVVIQNSGANVLIQNATVINLQFK